MQHQFNDGGDENKFAQSNRTKARRYAHALINRRAGYQANHQMSARRVAPNERAEVERLRLIESAEALLQRGEISSRDTRNYCLPDFEAPATMQPQTLVANYEQTEQGRLLCVQTVCCQRANGVRWIAGMQGVEVVEVGALRSSYILQTGDGQKMIAPDILHLRCDKAALARILAQLEKHEATVEENAPIWPGCLMNCLSIAPLPDGSISVEQKPVSLESFRRCFQEWLCRRWYDIENPTFSISFFGFKSLNCKPGPNAFEPSMEPLFKVAYAARHECAFDLTDVLTASYWLEFLSEYPARGEEWQALIEREGEPLALRAPVRVGCQANG